MPLQIGTETEIRIPEVRSTLQNAGIESRIVQFILDSLPRTAAGVVLYGSQARGDATPSSDVDLLVVADRHAASRSVGVVNVATYDQEQFNSARGTLFGMHVARDGLLLHDAGQVGSTIEAFGPIDEAQLWNRLADLASILLLPGSEQHANLEGFVRHARYVLRTATYALAIREGDPCFSVSELSERYKDPDLITLLSSHPAVQGPPSIEKLSELSNRVMKAISGVPPMDYSSLADVIVGEGSHRPELADSALMIIGPSGDGPYTQIPRVVL